MSDKNEFTEDGVYKPQSKIALAFSFEGIVNNGATECALTSFNALESELMREFSFSSPFGLVEPKDFSTIRNLREIEAFLFLRPLVEVAEDYLTVIQVINEHPHIINNLLKNPTDIKAIDYLKRDFELAKKKTKETRAAFKEAFYKERKRMQDEDYESWLNLQEPFPETIPELRYLIRTQKRGPDEKTIWGFVPYFATSKDEGSTFSLCEFYSSVQKLDPEDVSGDGTKLCIITPDKIIGKERTRDKLNQMMIIEEEELISPEKVWRLNDRYDAEQQEQLRKAGYAHQFIVRGGYCFPHDYERAEKEGITVLDRLGLAKALGRYAQEQGF